MVSAKLFIYSWKQHMLLVETEFRLLAKTSSSKEDWESFVAEGWCPQNFLKTSGSKTCFWSKQRFDCLRKHRPLKRIGRALGPRDGVRKTFYILVEAAHASGRNRVSTACENIVL